jgi:hypothetical protein
MSTKKVAKVYKEKSRKKHCQLFVAATIIGYYLATIL